MKAVHYCLVICRVSLTDQIYHRAANRGKESSHIRITNEHYEQKVLNPHHEV